MRWRRWWGLRSRCSGGVRSWPAVQERDDFVAGLVHAFGVLVLRLGVHAIWSTRARSRASRTRSMVARASRSSAMSAGAALLSALIHSVALSASQTAALSCSSLSRPRFAASAACRSLLVRRCQRASPDAAVAASFLWLHASARWMASSMRFWFRLIGGPWCRVR